MDLLDIIKQRTRSKLTPRLNDLSRQRLLNEIRIAEIDEPAVSLSWEDSTGNTGTDSTNGVDVSPAATLNSVESRTKSMSRAARDR